MKKIYEKNELNFALLWIGLYVVLFSVADSVSASIGIAKLVTAPFCIVMTGFLYVWICKNGLKEKYGLCKFKGELKTYLYFIPLVLLTSIHVWWGLRLNMSVLETLLYILSMLGVGFLEEVIFRGFLFKAMCKDNVTSAIVVSSITFGFGHIVNLLNGRDIPETLLQICYATAIGFLFTIIFYKGKGLWPCIVTHGVFNSLSVFANKEAATVSKDIVVSVFLCIVSVVYSVYILKKTGQEDIDNSLVG
ncbi:MAG: CPBP family intramembrane metalloprotease [Lachnospiraceae bacterium]|nr:CPBP family intramembrane metalloprotease [Lachnospiraceae bacterium]